MIECVEVLEKTKKIENEIVILHGFLFLFCFLSLGGKGKRERKRKRKEKNLLTANDLKQLGTSRDCVIVCVCSCSASCDLWNGSAPYSSILFWIHFRSTLGFLVVKNGNKTENDKASCFLLDFHFNSRHFVSVVRSFNQKIIMISINIWNIFFFCFFLLFLLLTILSIFWRNFDDRHTFFPPFQTFVFLIFREDYLSRWSGVLFSFWVLCFVQCRFRPETLETKREYRAIVFCFVSCIFWICFYLNISVQYYYVTIQSCCCWYWIIVVIYMTFYFGFCTTTPNNKTPVLPSQSEKVKYHPKQMTVKHNHF